MKKKLSILFFLQLFILLLGISSTGYATVSLTELQNNIQKIEDAGLLQSGATQTMINSDGWNNSSDSVVSLSNIRSDYLIVITTSNSDEYANRIFILFGDGECQNLSTNPSSRLYYNWTFRGPQFYLSGSSVNAGLHNLNKASFLYAYSTGGINTRSLQLSAGQELNYKIINIGIDWTYITGYQTTSVAGFNSTFYGYNRDYGVSFWNLGYLDGQDDFPKLRINLYKIYSTNIQQLVIDTSIVRSSFGWGTNNGIVTLSSNGLLAIASRLMNYSPYYMIVYAINDNEEVIDSCDAYFVFRQFGDAFPGTIGSGDYNGSGDYSSQNSTNDIIDSLTDTIEADSTLNNFFSGDTDDFASNLGYSPIENPFVSIISNTLQSMIDIILGSGNVDLDFSFGHQTYIVHSDDFTLPNGSIKTFVILVSNGFLVWLIVKYGMMLYTWINSGRIQNLMNEVNGHWYRFLF